MLPPWWVRRLVLVPLMLVVSAAAVVTFPVTAAVAALAGLLFKHRTRPLKVLVMVVAFLAAEGFTLLALGWLWVTSGLGRTIRSPVNERRHYVLVRRVLQFLYGVVTRVLHVRVEVEGPAPEAYAGRPLVVFCRHAGPGDSFLIVHALLDWYDREPRIVLKDTLQWDPAIDIVLNRLPNRFIRSGAPGEATKPTPGATPLPQVIGELSTRLDGDDALVLFPEGGNFTDRRRARAIARLRRKNLLAEVEKAEAMRNVLPPRPAGVLAVLENAREADVVWVAHTGTDHLLTVGDVWAALPVDTNIKMRWWQVDAGSVPHGATEQIEWLYDWWRRIDGWIGTNRPPRDPATRSGETYW